MDSEKLRPPAASGECAAQKSRSASTHASPGKLRERRWPSGKRTATGQAPGCPAAGSGGRRVAAAAAASSALCCTTEGTFRLLKDSLIVSYSSTTFEHLFQARQCAGWKD